MTLKQPVCICIIFFFQAEDGIRDVAVTGVQTCALPICRAIRLDVPSYDAQPSDPQPVGRRLYQKERLDSRSSQQGLSRMPEVGPSVASQSAEYAIRNEFQGS